MSSAPTKPSSLTHPTHLHLALPEFAGADLHVSQNPRLVLNGFPGPGKKFLLQAARNQTTLSETGTKPLLAAWRWLYGLPYQGSAEVAGQTIS